MQRVVPDVHFSQSRMPLGAARSEVASRHEAHPLIITIGFSFAAGLSLLAGPSARADIPATYKGTPFDPAVAGGPKCPATVKAGPYAIPGRLDFVNYDLGGDGVAYHTGDHITKGGTGYRTDGRHSCSRSRAAASRMADRRSCTETSSGTTRAPRWMAREYPSPTTADFSIGAGSAERRLR